MPIEIELAGFPETTGNAAAASLRRQDVVVQCGCSITGKRGRGGEGDPQQ